jgi:hypothetical protein
MKRRDNSYYNSLVLVKEDSYYVKYFLAKYRNNLPLFKNCV